MGVCRKGFGSGFFFWQRSELEKFMWTRRGEREIGKDGAGALQDTILVVHIILPSAYSGLHAIVQR